MVRLSGTDGHQRLGATAMSVCAQVLEFASLVPSRAEAGEIITLHPQSCASWEDWTSLERGWAGHEGNTRNGLNAI
jgi:hypothetical protein